MKNMSENIKYENVCYLENTIRENTSKTTGVQ